MSNRYSNSLTNTHRKKNQVVRSGVVAGHVIYGHPLPILLAGNCLSKNVLTMLAACDEARLTFSSGGLLRTKSTGHQFVIWQI